VRCGERTPELWETASLFISSCEEVPSNEGISSKKEILKQ